MNEIQNPKGASREPTCAEVPYTVHIIIYLLVELRITSVNDVIKLIALAKKKTKHIQATLSSY